MNALQDHRLVEDQRVAGEAAAAALRPRPVAEPLPRLEDEPLRSVRPRDALDLRRVLGGAGEDVLHPQHRLGRGRNSCAECTISRSPHAKIPASSRGSRTPPFPFWRGTSMPTSNADHFPSSRTPSIASISVASATDRARSRTPRRPRSPRRPFDETAAAPTRPAEPGRRARASRSRGHPNPRRGPDRDAVDAHGRPALMREQRVQLAAAPRALPRRLSRVRRELHHRRDDLRRRPAVARLHAACSGPEYAPRSPST
jgi:hypothetical protein